VKGGRLDQGRGFHSKRHLAQPEQQQHEQEEEEEDEEQKKEEDHRILYHPLAAS